MYRSKKALGGLCLTLALAACGGGNSGFILPVESPMKPWVAQSEDEILEKAGIEQPADEASDEEEFVDYEDDEDGDDDDDAGAPAPAPAPAKPAAAPAKPESKAKPVVK